MPHRAHWQPLDYNALHGGIERWFDALPAALVDDAAWAALLMKGRTTLIVAHRFSTIRDVDRVLVFDDGRIVADGTREAVYASSDLFRRLWDNQAKNLA